MPFDPAETGVNYSGNLVALNSSGVDVGFAANRGADKAFDGVTGIGINDASLGANVSFTAGANTQLVFTPSTPITGTTVEVTGGIK